MAQSYMSYHMIDEINESKKNFIHDTPQYRHSQFVSQQGKRFRNRKSDGAHPFSQQPSQTYYEDPLVVGSTDHFSNFLQFNNRAVSSETKDLKGGSEMYSKIPLGAGLESDSDDESSEEEYSSSEGEGGECHEMDAGKIHHPHPSAHPKGIHPANKHHPHLKKLSKKQLMEMISGGGIYNDYVKPAAKVIGHVGKEIFNDIVVPVGKELVKDAVKGALIGGEKKKRGRPSGSKNKAKALIEKVPEPPVVIEQLLKPTVKRVRKSKAVLKNLEEEKERVNKEESFEKGEIKAEEKGGKKKRVLSDKMKARAEIVKKVMKEHNLKLGAASKYVKEHNLA